MHVLTAPYLAAALLLAVAGAAKALDPVSTLRATRASGLRLTGAGVRLFGVVEAVVGLAALLIGGPVPAALVALCYVSFAIFVATGLMRGNLTSCGCFPGSEAPSSLGHVVLNVALAACAVAVMLSFGASALPEILRAHGAASAVLLSGLVALDAVLVYLVMARIPSARPGVPPVPGEAEPSGPVLVEVAA